MIRVLQVIGIVCGGGVESVVMNYYRHIDRQRVQFDFVVDGYEKTALDDEIAALGGHVYHIEPYRSNIFRYMRQIYRIVRDHHYRVVHSHMNTLAVFSLLPAYLAGARVRILHNHSTAVRSEGLRTVLKEILRPFAPLFANRYAACSVLAGTWMYGRARMGSGTVKVLRNAVDLEAYAFSPQRREIVRRELDIGQDAFVVGHVGRFVYQKNHPFLLEVFRTILHRRPDAILLLIGEGELRAAMEEKARAYGMADRVRFLGLRDDVRTLYSAMDVFVLPSWYEGLPVVAVEAQANGLPCFLSDRVTRESELTQSAHFLPLAAGAAAWAAAIAAQPATRNLHAQEEMTQAGFEIRSQACRLLDWYALSAGGETA